jgi:hypothetical protein
VPALDGPKLLLLIVVDVTWVDASGAVAAEGEHAETTASAIVTGEKHTLTPGRLAPT